MASKKSMIDDAEHSAPYYMAAITSGIQQKRKEFESMATRVEYEQRVKGLETEHQGELANLKTELKHVFNLDLQNMKLTYEHQLKQAKGSMKKQTEDIEVLRAAIVKKESEICLLRETNRHYENERRMYAEQTEFLSRVILLVNVVNKLND